MFGLYAQLFRLRFRWYALATGRLLMRHWQWLLLAFMLLPAGIPMAILLRGSIWPLTALFQPDRRFIGLFLHLCCIQLGAIAWIWVQHAALRGGDFMRYVLTLPIPSSVTRCVDLTMITAANNILLLPAILALSLSSATPQTVGLFRAWIYVVLFVAVLSAQYAALSRRRFALLASCAGNSLLAVSLPSPHGGFSWLLPGIDLTSSVALLVAPAATRWRRAPPPARARLAHRSRIWDLMQGATRLVPPAYLILIKALAERSVGPAVRLAAALIVVAAGNSLMRRFEFDERTLPTAILDLAVLGLVISGIYRRLLAVHADARIYMNSLPIRRQFWPLRDTLFVACCGIIPALLLLAPLFARGLCSLITLAAIACAYVALLALLRLPFAIGGRQAAVWSVVLAGVWSAATIAAVVR